jgi:uncharacterized membrane protein YgcG
LREILGISFTECKGGRASCPTKARLLTIRPLARGELQLNLLTWSAFYFLHMTLTATADTEAPVVPPPEPVAFPAAVAAERPVFAATTPTRPRALKVAGRVTAGLVGLWLVALVLGTFGFGPVAGIGLPRIGGGSSSGDEPAKASAPAHKAAPAHAGERITSSGVTLTARHGGSAAPATRRGSGPAGATRRGATHQGSGARPDAGGGSTGGGGVSGGSGTSGGGGGASQAPAPASGGASTAAPSTSSPATTTTTTNPHANPTHSQATPPGSSSTAPGSRSNATTAPGREQSASSPSPGSGRTEHAPPKG